MLRRLRNLNEGSVLYLLIAIAASSLFLSAFSHYQNGEIAWWAWADGAFQNFSTEMMGAILTFFLFELVVGTRKELTRLLIDLRSSNLAAVQNALAQIRANGSLHDGTLNSINLKGAHFDDVILNNAVLNGVNFENANLQAASLKNTQLQEANFKNANLSEADLSGANLRQANLESAQLEATIFDETTIMPDNQVWSQEIKLSHFTDPEHPNYWLGYHLVQGKIEGKTLDHANLHSVIVTDMRLSGYSFQSANFRRAKLSRADFRSSDFRKANLTKTTIQGCNFEAANLRDCHLAQAKLTLCKFNERTILPDGSNWVYGTDLSRFTDRQHPDFWQAE